MKRVTGLIVLLLLGFSLTTFAAEPVKVIHLAYTSAGQAQLNYLDTRAKLFKERTGIDVEVIVGDQAKFKTMLAGGVPPDVLELPDFGYLAAEGYYVDVKPLLQRDGLLKAYNPVLIQTMSAANGALYMFPQAIASVVGFFNRTMFQEAGVTNPLQLGKGYDWDSVISMGKKLTRDSNGDGTPEQFGVDRIWGYWRRAVAQAGGDFYEYNSKGQPIKSLWNSLPVEQGISFVARMDAEGISPWGHVGGSANEPAYYFWQGKTGIDIVDSTGIVGAYLKSVGWDWEMSLLPAGPKGPIASGAGGYGPNILASTKNLDAVWEWLKFIYLDRVNVTEMMRSVGIIPAYGSLQGAYAEVAGISKKNYQAIFEALNYLPPSVYAVVPSQLSARSVNVNDAMQNKVPVRQFLEQIHVKMQAIIDDLQKTS